MRRFPLFWFNAGMGLAFGTAYTAALRGEGPGVEALREAFLASWWAGALAGLSVGAGATLGPRPALPWRKCVWVQVLIVAASAAGALVAWLLPGPAAELDRLVKEEMTRRGLALGSGIGAAVGTAIQMVQVYFDRRRAARRK